jgi:hypothetical protein
MEKTQKGRSKPVSGAQTPAALLSPGWPSSILA